MTMRFPYRCLPVTQPLVPLRGRKDRPRPIIPVSIGGPAGSHLLTGLIDTGADDTILPDWLAPNLGLTLATAPTGTAHTAVVSTASLWYVQVTLRVADQQERREWQAWVGFTNAPIRQAYLGFAGFLEYFDVLFLGAQEAVELTVNATYPGT